MVAGALWPGPLLRTLRDLKWLLTEGKPSPALKAATLLYLHGVRVSSSIKMSARDAGFGTRPDGARLSGARLVFVTEMTLLLRAGQFLDDSRRFGRSGTGVLHFCESLRPVPRSGVHCSDT